MGRYVGPVCRLCRREGTKLYLKGSRCETKLCSLEKRDNPPGMHNWRKGKLSEYGQRLREKQKVKRYYGIFEAQFQIYFERAERQQGNTGENLLVTLESRLDSVICRGNFAHSRRHARQIIGHGHIRVNGKKVTVPSYMVKEGDVIQSADNERSKKLVKAVVENASTKDIPSWLELAQEPLSLKVVQKPARNEIQIDIQEQMVVEFCSR